MMRIGDCVDFVDKKILSSKQNPALWGIGVVQKKNESYKENQNKAAICTWKNKHRYKFSLIILDYSAGGIISGDDPY
jgi:hypothetical protein